MNYIKSLKIAVIIFVLFVSSGKLYSQTDTEFWFGAPDITAGHGVFPGGEPIYLRLSALALDANVSVDIPAAGISIANITVFANTTQTIDLTPWTANLENTNYGIIENKALHITSDNDITAYYEEAEYWNTDIFALKGSNALGTEFYIPLQNLWNNGNYTPTPLSGFIIVATQNNTLVTITPTKDLQGGHPASVTFQVTLDKGQTFPCVATSRNANMHPAGSHVTSNKPITVTIYDDSSTHSAGGCRDLNGDQLVPVDIIGKTYIALKGGLNSNERIFIVATEDDTDVDIDGVPFTNLAFAGNMNSIALAANATYVEADKPVYVYHVSGYGCEVGGAVLPTIDGCTGSYTVSITRSTVQSFYLNLMIKAGSEDKFYFEYEDGTSFNIPPSWFEPVPGNPIWVVLKAANSLFADGTVGGIPEGEVTRVYNTEDIFHLGFNNGGPGSGCNYGYFSDYKGSTGSAGEAGTDFSFMQKCYGIPIQLISEGGIAYKWAPSIYLDDPNIATPTVNAIAGAHHYDVTIDRVCYPDTTLGIDITIFPFVDAQFNVDKTYACAPLEVEITDNSIGAEPDKYRWDFGDGTPISNTSASSFTHVYENNTDTTQIYLLNLQVQNYADCPDTLTRKIYVQPFINTDFEPIDTAGCNPLAVQFRELVTGGNMDTTKFTWDFGDGGSSYDSIPSHVYINNTATDTTYITQLIAESKFGCKDTLETGITVHEYIKADYTIDTVAGCSPLIVNIDHNTYPGVNSYSWDFGDGNTYLGANPISHKYINKTGVPDTCMLSLIVKNDNNCADTLVRQIIVYPEVKSDFVPIVPAPVDCNPFSIDFVNSSVFSGTASNSGLVYNWNFGDGGSSNMLNPSHQFINPGNIDSVYLVNLNVVSPNGCMHDTSTIVTVHSFIEAKFSVDIVQGCSPLTVTVNNNSKGGIVNYYWDFDGDGSTDSSLTDNVFTKIYHNTTGVPIDNYLTLIVDNSGGCTDTLIRKVTVFSEVTADFTPINSVGCNTKTINFTNNSSAWTATYDWDFGDGGTSNESTPTHIFENVNSNDTIFNVQMIATTVNACTDTLNTNVTVYEYIKADFVVEESNGCAPFDVEITNNSSGGISQYAWDYGDGALVDNSSAANIIHRYENTSSSVRIFELQLVVQNDNACTDTLIRQISVYPEITADFSIDNNMNCHPLQVNITNMSSVPAPAIYNWSFGDGASSSQISPSHTFYNFSNSVDLTDTIRLIANSEYNCPDTIEKYVTIYHKPKASFDIDKTADCPPLIVNIDNTSKGAIVYSWIFGDGDIESYTANNFNHAYPVNYSTSTKDYELKLIATTNNNCVDSTGLTVNAYPKVTADFTMDSTGCNPLYVDFTNNSKNSNVYLWNFGDGVESSLRKPLHRFANITASDVSYSVQLIAKSEFLCRDTVKHNVTVYPFPETEFAVTPTLQTFPSSTISINNTTNVGPWTYNWSFGDEQTSNLAQPGTHVYNHWGEYEIKLDVASDNCSNNVSHNILIVAPEPQAMFSIDFEEGCVPLTVQFTNNSTYDETYLWDFDDGSTSTIENPVHIFNEEGIYYVKEIINGEGGEDYAYKTIRTYRLPEVDFKIENEIVMLPDEKMHVFDLSKYADTYLWDFGDGSSSDDKDPEHFYEKLGKYDVKLRVTTDKGCVDSLLKIEAITVVGEGMIEFPTAFSPSLAGSNGGYFVNGDITNDVFHPVAKGVIKYELFIYNRWGELIFNSNDINIGWDGYIDGELAKQDVYVWKVKGKFSNGKKFERAGDITLIR